MKVIATTAFLALPSANAIYLACCKRENECPTDRTDVMGLGDASLKVCCYDGEKVHASEDELEHIPTCLEEIATKEGPSISLMALPVPEGAEVQEPDAATPELAKSDDVACCKRESECPTGRTDVMGLGEASFKVCCYDGERVHASEDELEQIPTCLEDIATKGGPSIALMALPVREGAEVHESNDTTPEIANALATTLAATTAAEVPEETNAPTESPEATGNAEGTIENAPAAAETASAADSCCGTLAAVQRLRAGPARTSVCPENMFGVDSATYEDGGSSYQVCCDADDRRASEFIDSALSACEDGTARPPLDSDDAVDVVESTEAAPAESAGDAEAKGGPDVDADESNSANAMKNAAIVGMALVGAVLQVAL